MSGSFPIFDQVVEQLIGWMAPVRLLDIGAGAGKYGQIAARAAPGCERVAVEAHGPYLERFGLRDHYERVDIADAASWWRDNAEEAFDVVVLGDCLQNMPKSEGLDLLNALVYRASWLILLTPEFIVQGAVDGADSAVHRSVWSERDLIWHDLWAWDNARAISLSVLRGYRGSPLDIDTLVRRVNEAALPVHDYDGHSLVRPCRLRLVDQPREVGYRAR